LKWIGNAMILGGILGTFFHFIRYGPQREDSERDN
jgi:hypothetical protein